MAEVTTRQAKRKMRSATARDEVNNNLTFIAKPTESKNQELCRGWLRKRMAQPLFECYRL